MGPSWGVARCSAGFDSQVEGSLVWQALGARVRAKQLMWALRQDLGEASLTETQWSLGAPTASPPPPQKNVQLKCELGCSNKFGC